MFRFYLEETFIDIKMKLWSQGPRQFALYITAETVSRYSLTRTNDIILWLLHYASKSLLWTSDVMNGDKKKNLGLKFLI